MRYIKQKLYRISTADVKPINEWPESVSGYKLVSYTPNLFSLGKYGTNFLVNLMWYILCGRKFLILLLFDQEVIVHYYYITSKTYRFGYMNKEDINLGQTFTLPSYRGRGIHTSMERVIRSYYAQKPRFLWGYVDIGNKASQRVMEKSGFEFVSYAKMSTMTGIVRKINDRYDNQ